jgi:hypothetical protein
MQKIYRAKKGCFSIVKKKLFLPLNICYMKQTLLFLFILFFTTATWAQKNVSYNIESGINMVEQRYLDAWKKVKKIEGFRIQITSFSGVNSRALIEKTAEQFKQQFPDILCNISYSEPNFRLRVGNYRTKLEAYKDLHKIAHFFPGAFVFKDQIDISN